MSKRTHNGLSQRLNFDVDAIMPIFIIIFTLRTFFYDISWNWWLPCSPLSPPAAHLRMRMRPWFCPVVFSSHRMDDPITSQSLFAIHAIPMVPTLTVPLPRASSSAVQRSDGDLLNLQMHASGEDRQLNLSVFNAISRASVHHSFARWYRSMPMDDWLVTKHICQCVIWHPANI